MQRLLPLLVLGLTACAGPAYTIVVHSTSPIAAPCHLYVEPVHIDNLKVGKKTEAEWQATKKPDAQASWQKDKEAFAELFRRELIARVPYVSAQPVSGAYVLRPSLQFFEPGFYAFVAAQKAESRMLFQLLDPTGATVLEEAQSSAEGSDFSVGATIRDHAKFLAHHLARYVAEHLGACAQ